MLVAALWLTAAFASQAIEDMRNHVLAGMPAALVYRTVRRLVDAERFDDADDLFYDRYFPREEGGINVRQVYLEARVGRAAAAVTGGRCDDAMDILDALIDVNARLEFTRTGLAVWLDRSGLAETTAELQQSCRIQGRSKR